MSEEKKQVELFQLHLRGKGHSGRSVRYRLLSLAEVDDVESKAFRPVDGNDERSLFDVKASIVSDCLNLMVQQVSESHEKSAEPASIKWRSVVSGELAMKWSEFFTYRDTAVLRHVYQTEYGVTAKEIEDLFAGKVRVLAE